VKLYLQSGLFGGGNGRLRRHPELQNTCKIRGKENLRRSKQSSKSGRVAAKEVQSRQMEAWKTSELNELR